MLGRYALYEKIASGGMASVHIGRLLGPVGFARTVAIKRMHPQFAEDPEFVSMFLDEARLAARIRHPNVVPTLDVVAMSDELFLVMDFVQGESLSFLIRASTLRKVHIAPEMTAAILVGALHGLHAAHEAKGEDGTPLGLVHRDVSPHNILVGTDGVARVLDFGVAKAAGRLQTTREGQLKGKLGYMAPEQVRGEGSRATDVYAASVVLWEALTGRRLFRADNDAQTLDRVLKGCDVPPSRFAPGLPAAIDEVTMRGLRVDPAERFATARDMARALEEAIALAPASRIGDWVEASAKDTLDQRSARIASIESDSSLRAPPSPSPTSSASQPAEIVVHEAEVPTQLSSGSVSSPGTAPRAGARRRTAWLAVAGGGAVLLAAALFAARSRLSIPAPAAASGTPAQEIPAAPAALPSGGPAAEALPPSAEPSSFVAPPSASSAHGLPSAAPTARPLAPARGMGRASGQASPTPAPTPSSKPSYNPLEHL